MWCSRKVSGEERSGAVESSTVLTRDAVSRFNHDCRPNADYWFDPQTLVQHVYATRNIYPGEELSLSYME